MAGIAKKSVTVFYLSKVPYIKIIRLFKSLNPVTIVLFIGNISYHFKNTNMFILSCATCLSSNALIIKFHIF